MTKTKAILFDLDNTLINTHEVLNKYLVNLSQKYYKITPKEEYFLETVTIEEVMNWMKKRGIKIYPWTKTLTIIHFVFTDIKKITPFEGVVNLLENLETKIPLAVITNGPNIYAKRVMRRNKLIKYFKTIQTVNNNKPKPDPEMIYAAAKKIGVKANECIVVDDGKTGISAGTKAGCTTIYFSKNKNIKANYYVKNISEMEKLLNKLIKK